MTLTTHISNIKPVFICGHRRTGTTLFICLLENHPELLVYPPDSGFFYAYYPIYENVKYTNKDRIEQIIGFCIRNFDEFLRESFSGQEIEMIGFDMDSFRNKFRLLVQEKGYSSKDLLLSLMQAYHLTWKYPKQPAYWIEKTTSSEIYASEIMKWFPEAKFIHIIRDPRDNWASLKSGWEKRFKHHNDSLDRLMHSMIERGKFGFELSVLNQKRFGRERYKIVRYEDLVTDTRETMKHVCKFIGISFSEKVLVPTVCGRPWRGNSYVETKFSGPSSQNVDRWRERITDNEAMLLEYHFQEYMEVYNYPLRFGLEDRIDAAVEHYKWYNYAQAYSFSSTQYTQVPVGNVNEDA
jgi:hypothetical protein